MYLIKNYDFIPKRWCSFHRVPDYMSLNFPVNAGCLRIKVF